MYGWFGAVHSRSHVSALSDLGSRFRQEANKGKRATKKTLENHAEGVWLGGAVYKNKLAKLIQIYHTKTMISCCFQ